MQLTHTNTTQFLITRTTRLRSWARRIDGYTVSSLLVIVLIVAGGIVRNAQPAERAPIIVVATQALPAGQHGAVRRVGRAPAASGVLPTAIVPTAPVLPPTVEPVQVEQPIRVQNAPEQATQPGYTAHTTAGDLFVPDNATPVPPGTTYTGPFLAPISTEEPPSGPRLCTGFNDRRDYDPAYAASPVCHPPAP